LKQKKLKQKKENLFLSGFFCQTFFVSKA